MRDKIIVEKMIQYSEKISDYVKGMDRDQFMSNSIVIDACVFNLSQIGELVGKISKEFEKDNKEIPWRQIYGLRNRIVHDYEGVNYDLVWEIVNEDIPNLIEKLKVI